MLQSEVCFFGPQMTQMSQIESDKRDPQTYAIIGAAMEAHTQLGCGFLEAVYQDALAFEFELRDILFRREVGLPVTYKGRRLSCSYCADFIVYDEIVVEIKALTGLGPIEEAQVLNYLKATGLRRGLLFNFGGKRLEYKRFVYDEHLHRTKPSV